jgi:hypothetical protein
MVTINFAKSIMHNFFNLHLLVAAVATRLSAAKETISTWEVPAPWLRYGGPPCRRDDAAGAGQLGHHTK